MYLWYEKTPAIFLTALLCCSFYFQFAASSAQCPIPSAVVSGGATGACSGGAGAISNGNNINSGETRWFTGGPTTFTSGININGGTLRVCGNLRLSSINISGSGANKARIIIESGGSLTIDGSGDLNFGGHIEITNRGTLTINRNLQLQNDDNYIVNHNTLNLPNSTLILNSTTSFIINNGNIAVAALNIQTNSGGICMGALSTIDITTTTGNALVNNALNSITVLPTGARACISYKTNAELNQNLTNTSNLIVCRGPVATTSGGSGFGAATVQTNCANCAATPLPVTLAFFRGTATPAGILLEWQVAAFEGFAHFVVERSANGSDFMGMQKVEFNPARKDYAYTDAPPSGGIHYYRLRQVDEDGSVEYSKIIAVATQSYVSQGLSVFPNPSINGVFTVHVAPHSHPFSIVVIDNKGRQVVDLMIEVKKHECVIDLSGHPKGLYYARVSSSAYTDSVKLLVR